MVNPSLVVYTDGSAIGENLRAAAVMLDSSKHTTRASKSGVGSTRNWTVLCAELIGIYSAIDLATQEQIHKSQLRDPQACIFTILCNSCSALQALDNLAKRLGQSIINEINRFALQAKENYLATFRL